MYVRRAKGRPRTFLVQKWAEVKRRILKAHLPLLGYTRAQSRSGTASPFDHPFTSQLTWVVARKPDAFNATSTSRIQTRAAESESPGISRTLAYAIDCMDNTQLHLAKVEVECTAKRTGLSGSLLDRRRLTTAAFSSGVAL